MSIASNAGAQSVAEEIRGFVDELLGKIARGEGEWSTASPDGVACATDALKKVREKCDGIAKVAESGWY